MLASALLPSSHDEALERERREVMLSLSDTSPAEVGGLPNLKVSAGASRSSSSFFLMAANTSCGKRIKIERRWFKSKNCLQANIVQKQKFVQKQKVLKGEKDLLLFVKLRLFHGILVAPLP